MKRYFLVKEFFGIRVYDSKLKKEYYFDKTEQDKIINLLKDDVNLIDNAKINQMSAPLKISMNLTKKCNLRCKQCFSDSGDIISNELSTNDIFLLFDDMQKNGTFYICLGGGEPFTREDLFEILEYGKNKQLAISIVSNGLLINESILKKLNKLDLDYLWISFEGLKENHEKLRGLNTFDRTIEKLKLLQQKYKGKKAIRMSINKNNINEMEDIVKIAERYDFDLVRFTPLLSFGRAKDKEFILNQDEYIYFLKKVKLIKSKKLNIIYPNMPNDKIWISKNGFGCHCGKEAVWIDELGNYSPCIFWGENFTIGNIKNESYIDLWNKNLVLSNIKGNDTCKDCKNYELCRAGCRARSLFEYGDLDHVDPLCPLKKQK